jgi:hypothetical protein
MDTVFIANGLAATETTYRSAKVEQDYSQGTTMEVAASRVLPYDLESTRHVAWRHFNDVLSKMPDRVFFEYHEKQKVRRSTESASRFCIAEQLTSRSMNSLFRTRRWTAWMT